MRVLGELIIQNFREQAAGDWGAAYTRFLKKLGSSHLAATVLLPREELTVRQVALPGVSDKDLDAAIRFEIDSLNPYAEEDVASDFSRIGPTASVLIGLTRLATLERYTALFSQAGIKVASFTFSAAAVYAALRLNSTPAGDGFVAMEAADGEVEAVRRKPYQTTFVRPCGSACRTSPRVRDRRIENASRDGACRAARCPRPAVDSSCGLRPGALLPRVCHRSFHGVPAACSEGESVARLTSGVKLPGCATCLPQFSQPWFYWYSER